MLTSNLKSEIIAMAKDILENQDHLDSNSIYHTIQKLYEKTLVLNYIEQHNLASEMIEEENAIVLRFEKLAANFLATKENIPESNPHQDDLITSGMMTIKDMVGQMEELPVDEALEAASKTLNEQLSSGLKLGLNDRLAFTKHLFDDHAEDLTRVLNTLTTIESKEKALEFINAYIKPEYNNWVGKEAYERRFLNLILAQYS